MINHTTRHWTASPLAFQFFNLLYRAPTGESVWVKPTKYGELTKGFKPDPKKVGLEFLRSAQSRRRSDE